MLVLNDRSGPYAEFAKNFADFLEGSNWRIEAADKAENLDLANRRTDLLVTAGSEAFRQALSQTGSTPVLATLLPRLNYERILQDHGKGRRRVSAIYLDQPASRQVSFIRHLLPGQKRIGLLTSSETRPMIAQLIQAASQAGLLIDNEDSDTDNALLPSLNNLLPRINVLLALPDASIYKRDNMRSILVTTYRHQRPLIGFSVAMVNAGAMAAIYSTPSQIARQAAELVGNSGILLPNPVAPAQFAISINPNVVHALGLNVPDEASIHRSMLADREAR